MNKRSRIIGRAALAGGFLWIAVQAIPVDRQNPPVQSEVSAPDSVMAILHRACYNCHSNRTRWPWYSYIAPFSWLVSSHVHQGRGDLNFSEWPSLDFELQDLALRDIETQVTQKKMPPRSYTFVHRKALLGDRDRETLLRWARQR